MSNKGCPPQFALWLYYLSNMNNINNLVYVLMP